MNADWLGHYTDGADSWGPDGSRAITFSRDTDGTIRFRYNYRCESNHGYTVKEHTGLVVSCDDSAITVEIVSMSADSQEDMLGECFTHDDTFPPESRQRVTIAMPRIEDGKPVLTYEGVSLTFDS